MRFFLLGLAVALWSHSAPARAEPGADCVAAIRAAEVSHALPSGLLLAIGRVESGRTMPGTREIRPWPWAVNAAGQGRLFESEAEAIAYVTAMQGQGVTSIDTGCMQVNLHWHPGAFATLQDAFDPWKNADYAARFLSALHGQSGSWSVATGWYHSQNEALAEPYRQVVEGRAAPLARRVPAAPSPLAQMAAAWGATMPQAGAVAGWSVMRAPNRASDARFRLASR